MQYVDIAFWSCWPWDDYGSPGKIIYAKLPWSRRANYIITAPRQLNSSLIYTQVQR